MQTGRIHVRVGFPEDELLDAAQSLTRLLDAAETLELPPPLCHLLLLLDDAITAAFERHHARARLGTTGRADYSPAVR